MTLVHKKIMNGDNRFHLVDTITRLSLCGMSDSSGSLVWDDKTDWAYDDKKQVLCTACKVADREDAVRTPVPQSLLDYDFHTLAQRIGSLVREKNNAYGDSFLKSGEFLRLLYPTGIKAEQYNDVMTIARVYDKLQRIATDKDAFGENPWQDIVGYGLLSIARREVSGGK